MKCKTCKVECNDEFCSLTCYLNRDKTKELIVYPFCGENDFDKEGLKYHLQIYCDEYKKIDGNI